MCNDCGYAAVLEQVEASLIRARAVPRFPSEGAKFADSVSGKLTSIKQWIVSQCHVTDDQLTAIENMGRGIEKWTPDYDDNV